MTQTLAMPVRALGRGRAAERPLDLLDFLFLVGAFLAPVEIRLGASFTAHDLVISVLAFLIVAGPVRLRRLPAQFIAPVLVFLFAALVSGFRATFPFEAITQTMQFVFVFFVEIPVVLTVARTRKVMYLSLAMFVLGSLGGIAIAAIVQQESGAGRLVAFFSDNPNRLGYPVAYLLPFVLLFLRGMWRRRGRLGVVLVGAGTAWLMVWALTASASRGALAGTLVSILLAAGLPDGPGRGRGTAGRLAVVLALTAMVGIIIWRTDMFPTTLKERIERTLASEDSLISDRERLNAAGYRAFRASPLIGTGLDNFRYVAVLYEDSATDQAPHNLWVELLAQVGIVGTIAFALIILRWFVYVIRPTRLLGARAGDRRLCWAFAVSMLSLMTIFMTVPIMVHRHYWMLFGLGIAAAGFARNSAVEPPAHRFIPSPGGN